ncbi:MAG: sigma-70 family RNA polymerase sigma factor [Gaiellales bacterium]
MTEREAPKEGHTEHLSDHGLLALVARGDGDAFARLYDMYGEVAYSLALRIVRDRDLAADVVQEAFMTVWNQAAKFDPSRGRPSTWILTMTHHRAVDIVRREQRRRSESLDQASQAADPAPPVEERAWLGVARTQIAAALRTLPDPHREVIELAYFAGYTQSELAERLSLPLGTVKSRTFAAMTALREALQAAGLNTEGEWNTSMS